MLLRTTSFHEGDRRSDFLVIGGGICGLTIALALRKRHPQASIAVIEGESEIGVHASGRNSGVLHAGIYYDSSSLKAQFCREGAAKMRAYCEGKGLALLKSGKVIVPTSGFGVEDLLRLKRQADANGVRTEMIDASQLKEIEPDCVPTPSALYSPDTATIDPKQVLGSLLNDLRDFSVPVIMGGKVDFIDQKVRQVRVGAKTWNFGFLINTAGAGSLKLAQMCGLGANLTLLPFRGSYYEVRSATCDVRGNIYPVPDPRFPFLGVHLTRSVKGRIFAGPTAWPLVNPTTLKVLASEYLTNRGGLRRHMHAELRNHFRSLYFRKVQQLLPKLKLEDLVPSEKWGVRAQLYDTAKKKLVTDFQIERTDNGVHILNMISPGFTCSLSFADHVADLI